MEQPTGLTTAIADRAGKYEFESMRRKVFEKYPSGMNVGQPVLTQGFEGVKVMFAVVPKSSQDMQLTVYESLRLADKHNIQSMAFALMGTGALHIWSTTDSALAIVSGLAQWIQEPGRAHSINAVYLFDSTPTKACAFVDAISSIPSLGPSHDAGAPAAAPSLDAPTAVWDCNTDQGWLRFSQPCKHPPPQESYGGGGVL